MTDPTLVVSEIFGPTLQGEGPWQGKPTIFLRLGRCNLSCNYCDTPYTWDWARYDPKSELTTLTLPEIISKIEQLAGDNLRRLIVSGGEPLLQQKNLIRLLTALRMAGWKIGIESNGTISPEPALLDAIDLLAISPHLPANAGEMKGAIDLPKLGKILQQPKTILKIVVGSEASLQEAIELVTKIEIDNQKVWVMPEGTTPTEIITRTQHLATIAIQHTWNLSTRLHTLIWGDARAH